MMPSRKAQNIQSNSMGVRLQMMSHIEQALVLSRLAQAHSLNGCFTSKQLGNMFDDSALPKPSNVSDVIGKLRGKKYITKANITGCWTITPLGRQASLGLLSDMDLAALGAESSSGSSLLGQVAHTVVLPALAPPKLIPGLHKFLEDHPFEKNVFGMTRFPDHGESLNKADPVHAALEVARSVCRLHGLQFHLASDRAIDDDLWTNVTAHMWACRYGIAFFEDRMTRGLNYNLTIEVGSMLMTGRRCALLKDTSIPRMPTDLVGHIYKGVDLEKPETVANALHEWASKDLNLGSCNDCLKQHDFDTLKI
jgi:hypothetical protein